MSAMPEYLGGHSHHRNSRPHEPIRHVEPEDEPASTFWHWFAVGVLLFCWIAEASMCADRGF
jgi:hypothetical protein